MNRTLGASSANTVNALVFSGGEIWNQDESDTLANANLSTVPGPSGDKTNQSSCSDEEQKVSTYVRVFEDMVCTIIKDETHLLSDEEFALLTVFAHLSYNARFLMVKLLLRKQDTWHRLDTLKYERELGSVSAIVNAIDELCKMLPETSEIVKEGLEEQEVVDLTMDESVANLEQEQDEPAPVETELPELPSNDRPFVLARDEREMDLKSLLECLRVDELKAVAKELKLKTNQKKDDLIRDLLGTSSSQLTLTDFACRDGFTPSKGRGHHQTKLTFGKLRSQQDRLRQVVLRYIVKCVRVDEEFFGVIHRVNLVYFRMTQYTPGIFVAALLSRFGKRAYAGYDFERTKDVWPTRQALVDYEKVLILEGEVDTFLAGNVPLLGGRAVRTKTPIVRSLPTPVTTGNANGSRENEDLRLGDQDMDPDVKPDSVRVRGARMVMDIFEQVYPSWQDLVETEGEEVGRAVGLQRFHHGHVLTRIICKSSAALGILGEHERELEVLEALLAQRKWRRGQRGKWHERRAVILSNHLPKNEGNMERTLDAVMEALRDLDTHIVYRSKLQKRLRKLENKLKIPPQERHTCDGSLMDADEVEFKAFRLKHRAASLKLDRTGRCIDVNTSQQGNHDIKRYYSPVATPVKPEPNSRVVPPSRNETSPDIWKGKSLWLGRNGEELTVEHLALQRYEEQGFKGVHCETRVISMLFGLLFWDIIFKSIPGAFETPYQTAPLDITEDSFYHARKDLMEERLAAIEAGKGVDLVRDVDAKHRASETWCVGVRWDLFSSQDLIDIVMCIGGKALSVICRVLCEDYKFGSSGGPDLFLWNTEKGTCKFVEVKGPGDSLQENQRVWIDILLKAPVAVEICRVTEDGVETDKKPNARTPKSTRKKSKKARRKEEATVDADDDADALPSLADDSYMGSEEDQLVRSSPGPVDFCIATRSAVPVMPSPRIAGRSITSKRKASPSGAMSSPSKRPRTS